MKSLPEGTNPLPEAANPLPEAANPLPEGVRVHVLASFGTTPFPLSPSICPASLRSRMCARTDGPPHGVRAALPAVSRGNRQPTSAKEGERRKYRRETDRDAGIKIIRTDRVGTLAKRHPGLTGRMQLPPSLRRISKYEVRQVSWLALDSRPSQGVSPSGPWLRRTVVQQCGGSTEPWFAETVAVMTALTVTGVAPDSHRIPFSAPTSIPTSSSDNTSIQ